MSQRNIDCVLNEFCDGVYKLVDLGFNNPTKVEEFLLSRLHATDKIKIINGFGPFLYDNQDYIAERNMNYFINYDFSEFKPKWKKQFVFDWVVDNIEQTIKNNLKRFNSKKDKEIISDICLDLATLYCEFLLFDFE